MQRYGLNSTCNTMGALKEKFKQELDNGIEVITSTEKWKTETIEGKKYLYTGWKPSMKPHFSITTKLVNSIMHKINSTTEGETDDALKELCEIYAGDFMGIRVINSELVLELVTRAFLEKYNIVMLHNEKADVSKSKRVVTNLKSAVSKIDEAQLKKLTKMNPELVEILKSL